MSDNQFVGRGGRKFFEDPSGRHPFRAVEYGKWSPLVSDGSKVFARRDPEGAKLLAEKDEPVPNTGWRPSHRTADAVSPELESRVSVSGSSGVSSALVAVGWIGLVLAIVAGLLIVAEANNSSYYSSGPDASVGWFVAIAGSLQSLLLIGFARILVFTKATAVLLAQNLAEVRSPSLD